MNPRDIGKLMDTPDYAAWKGLRDAVDSRYVALCMPRVLSRLPYGAKSEPVEEFAFEEDTDGHKGEKYGWMNAAYAMAANINRAFKEYGWTVRIRGVQSGGEVINLPTHTFPTDDGGVDLKCPTEIAITDRREAELSKAGLISIIHRKNTDKAAFIGAQSVYKPKTYMTSRGDGVRQSVGAHSLHVRGVALRALSQMHGARQDRLDQGKGTAREVAERMDHALCRRRSEEFQRGDQGALPLAAAKVTVVENEENPGYYSANFYLRPHFQLEGMDIGMSLVSKLPAEAGKKTLRMRSAMSLKCEFADRKTMQRAMSSAASRVGSISLDRHQETEDGYG
jgi:type VI secretion system protein ImpC